MFIECAYILFSQVPPETSFIIVSFPVKSSKVSAVLSELTSIYHSAIKPVERSYRYQDLAGYHVTGKVIPIKYSTCHNEVELDIIGFSYKILHQQYLKHLLH